MQLSSALTEGGVLCCASLQYTLASHAHDRSSLGSISVAAFAADRALSQSPAAMNFAAAAIFSLIERAIIASACSVVGSAEAGVSVPKVSASIIWRVTLTEGFCRLISSNSGCELQSRYTSRKVSVWYLGRTTSSR